jgi:hypothetical protein
VPPALVAMKLKEEAADDMLDVLQFVQVEPEVRYLVSLGTSTCTMKEVPWGMVSIIVNV